MFSAFSVAEANAWWFGAILGAVHGMIAGTSFAMIRKMHRRMGDQAAGGSAATGIHLRPPGLFGKNYGSATPAGVLMAHVIFGLVLGLVYAWLI